MTSVLRPTLIASLTALSIASAGCAPIRSTKLPAMNSQSEVVKTQGGMVYHLPMQRLKLTLTVTAGTGGAPQTRTITVAPTTAFADPGARYVAQYRRNQIGSNTLKIGVNADGLLSGEQKGTNTPQVAQFLAQLASGTERMFASKANNPGCAQAGSYEWVLDAGGDNATGSAGVRQLSVLGESVRDATDLERAARSSADLPCGLSVAIDNLGVGGAAGGDQVAGQWRGVSTRGDSHGYGHGYFYRQRRPVQVTVTSDDGQRKVFVVSLVDRRSAIAFLPIPRTLFAEATWSVSFTDGSPTVFDVNAGGDVLGLAKLPADVLKAYSQAVTAGLNDRKGMATAETEYLKQLAALAAQQAKYEACRAAAQGGDLGKIQDACK
jgi:hypothetical protein